MQTWEEVIDSAPNTKPLPTPSGLQQSPKQAEAGMNSLVSQLSGLWGKESGLCLREARVTPTESKFLRGHAILTRLFIWRKCQELESIQ